MTEFHALLSRQLRRHRPPDEEIGADWLPLIEAVDAAYRELSAANDDLRRENTDRQGIEAELNQAKARLEEESALLEVALATERRFARHDGLTGALNHGAITAKLRSVLEATDGESRATTIAMIDVDAMKAINDTFGHQTGDEVLKAVARALHRNGAIVGRYGGDEFVAILPGAASEEGERYRTGVMADLAAVRLVDEETRANVPVLASIGLATYPAESTRIEELVKLADSAMYAAKRQRPAAPGVAGAHLSLDDARAAKMIGELVPLLASVGPLDEKLRLVSQRLSAGTGYHAVNFDVFEENSEEVEDRNTTMGTNAYVDAPDQLVEQWRAEQRTVVNHPLGDVLRRTQRPIIMDDLASDERLTEQQRTVLKAVGIQSGIAVPLLWQDEWIGTMSVGSREMAAFGPRDAQFLMAVAAHASAIIRTARMVEQLRLASDRLASAHNDTVLMLAASVEAHDSTTGRHLQRVSAVTESLALELGYADEDAHRLGMASVLHDIGKVRVPDAILKSEDRLSEEQWIVMKQHTVWGADFLAGHSGYELASLIARAHHERWDGSGYPYSLAGEAIAEPAAIVTVADAFDAMISDRPYRRARSLRSAMREIFSNSGQQFNPRVVSALLRVYRAGKLPAGDAAERTPSETGTHGVFLTPLAA